MSERRKEDERKESEEEISDVRKGRTENERGR